jgi:beta-glucosidase
VIQCFYPGALGGRALADIVFGIKSPSGRLPVTFYKSTSDLPDFSDISMKGRTYRFFEGKPVYRFGHGLTYADIKEEWIDDYTVRLINNSDTDTFYSVLRYEDGMKRKLLDFKKVKLIKKSSITVNFKQKEDFPVSALKK